MMKLNLQQFAKTASQMIAYRKSKGITKSSMPGQPAKHDHSFAAGRVSEINRKKNYVVYEVKDANDSNERNPKKASGASLWNMMAYNKIKYNKRKRVWIGSNKKTYVIRER